MPNVRLRSTSLDGADVEDLELELSEVDVNVLSGYVKNFERIQGAKIFENEFPTIKHVTFKPETGIVFDISAIDYGQVCEMLHLARPLFLGQEPFSFEKTQAIFGRLGRGTTLAKHMKAIRELYERGEYQPYFQITVGGTQLFSDATIMKWLNGVEYHQDSEKAEMIDQLEKSLGSSVARGIFVSQLSGRFRATAMVAHLCRLVLSPPAAGKCRAL